MKRLTIGALVALATISVAQAAEAHWTGRSEVGWSVTHQPMITCEYDFYGQKFLKSFLGTSCPYHIEVQ